jgi:small subunit ribosomal protein S17e
MGKVRVSIVKRLAKEMLSKYPDRFSEDFEVNKEALSTLAVFPSKKIRNQVAGYITRLKKIERAGEQEEQKGQDEEGPEE